MDQALVRFRKAAARENRDRGGVRRRYSARLQQQAVEYSRVRQRQGDGLREVAAALGVVPWSLHRWRWGSEGRPQFHEVQVVAPECRSSGALAIVSSVACSCSVNSPSASASRKTRPNIWPTADSMALAASLAVRSMHVEARPNHVGGYRSMRDPPQPATRRVRRSPSAPSLPPYNATWPLLTNAAVISLSRTSSSGVVA
jgi:hypothetical protein